MSYPPGPPNPYGQQPHQQPYGYPQQPAQPQPGWGYPQQPQQPQVPYGYPGGPGGPQLMPPGPKGARVLLIVVGVLEIIFALIFFAFASWLSAADDTGEFSDYTGISWFIGVFEIAIGALCMAMAAKFKTGGPSTRAGAILLGSLIVVISLASLVIGGILSVFTLVLGILVIVFSAKAETAAWFNRPRY
ncbi:hypothetical protein OG607_17300 [Streptomyces sp. NBC_01537]|uniref:hypothetical protein n=1 Tax=Streptomyces sp. NBC_01537 TaxID=2903896 RepID=UPI003863A9EC